MKARTLLLILASVALSVSALGQYRDLHDFGGTVVYANGVSGQDGSNSMGAVTVDGAGNIYGTTVRGGLNDAGMVWEISGSGQYLDLHDFGGKVTNSTGTVGPDGVNPEAGVTLDGSGNIFGTTWDGGSNGGGIVWEITAAGKYLDLHDFGGTVTTSLGTSGMDGVNPLGITLDGKGDLFGITIGGAFNNSGLVWEITAAGKYLDMHDFGGTLVATNGDTYPDGTGPNASVTFDSAGNMYGTAGNGGANTDVNSGNFGYGMVWEITTSGTYLDLHDFGGSVLDINGNRGWDGIYPCSNVTFDAAGNMYGTTEEGFINSAGGVLWKITASGTYVVLRDFGGTIICADGTSGSDGNQPYAGVTIDSAGNLYGTTLYGGTFGGGIVWEMTASGTYLDLHDLDGTIINADGTIGSDGNESFPGVTIDSSGKIYGVGSFGGPDNSQSTFGDGMVWSLSLSSHQTDPTLKSLGVSPVSVQGGTSSTGVLTLSAGASANDTFIPLSSSNSAAGVPAKVSMQAGAVTATFTVSTTPVNTPTTVTLTAGSGTGALTTTLTITPATLLSVVVTPTSVIGGADMAGTVTLSGPAGPGGAVISLACNDSGVSIPASVTIAAGKSSGTFNLGTATVRAATSATITAVLRGQSQTATVNIDPVVLASVSLSPTMVAGGNSSVGTVSLDGPAGSGNVTVSLSSNNLAVKVPATVTILSGRSSASFAVKTSVVSKQQVVAIMARSGTVSKTVSLTVSLPAIALVRFNPSEVVGGAYSIGTVTLTGPAGGGGAVVKLSGSGASASWPASVTVKPGATSAMFIVKTAAVQAPGTLEMSASLDGASQTATLTINPPALVLLTVSPSSVVGGRSSTGRLVLSGPAPSGGLKVSLSSSANSVTVAATITIPAGSASATFAIKTKPVSSTTKATITASLSGGSETATLSLTH
jgi:hypothetical protein